MELGSPTEWKTKTAHAILFFNVWNTEAINFPETILTVPWYRTHVLCMLILTN